MDKIPYASAIGSLMYAVARVRRRDKKYPPSYFILSIKYLANTVRQRILVFYLWKNRMGVAT
jgi:hypothetical protein